MATYVTFGSAHHHVINGKVLDHNCVAVIKSISAEEGRREAFRLFGNQFSFEYWESEKLPDMSYYSRGLIHLEG